MPQTSIFSPETQLFCRDGTVWLKTYTHEYDKQAPPRDLCCSSEGFRLIVADGYSIYFNGYFQNIDGLHFVSGWHVLQKKKPVKTITTVKKSAAPIVACSPVFLRAGQNVLCCGKRMSKVDADSFRCVPNTCFSTDIHTLFAWSLTDGLARLEMDTSRLKFLSALKLDYCTDGERVYHQSSWTEKIESFDLDEDSQKPEQYPSIRNAVRSWVFSGLPADARAGEQEWDARYTRYEWLMQSFRRLFETLPTNTLTNCP